MVAGILITILFLSAVLSVFEYTTGNADGVWRDLDIRLVTYRLMLGIALVALLIYPLIYGPHMLRQLIAGTAMLAVLLVLLEGVCYLIFRANEAPAAPTAAASTAAAPTAAAPTAAARQPFLRPDWTDSFTEDEILGVRAKKNWSLRWAPFKDGVLYDSITVSTDEYSLRTTLPSTGATPERHALFFGCSYTYGDGVSDPETYPHQFQNQFPIYRAYNLGYLAYSPLQMLARLQQEDLTRITPYRKGFGVYTYINDHIDRTLPATRWITMVKGNFPALDKSTLTTDGVFAHRHRLYSDFIQWFRTTYIHHVFRVDFPKKHTETHYRLVVDIMKKSKEEYQRQFGPNPFYIVIFPGNPVQPEMRKYLQEAGLTVFDYSGLLDLEQYLLPFDDAHPNAKAYQLVAAQLAKDIASQDSRVPAHPNRTVR
jgi:hypothetical protein